MQHISRIITVIIVGLVVIGCGEKIPIKEMLKAKKAIKRAYTVKADKYAPKLLDEAKNSLFSTHDEIKKDELEKAKNLAVKSEKKANEAYDKAVVLLAKDTIEAAQKSVEGAKVAYAERLAKDELKAAEDDLKKANEQFQSKKYYESYLTALEADKKAKKAREVALSKKNLLQDAITSVKSTLKKAKKYNVEKYAAEKYKLAAENLKIAEDSYGDLKLKKGFSAIEVAKINADEALVAGMEATAKDKIANSEALLDKAKKSEGAEVAKDELAAAVESLKNSKSYLSNSKYDESIASADESARLSTIVLGTKKPTVIVDNKDGKDGNDGTDPDASSGSGKTETDYYLFKVRNFQKYGDCLWNIAYRYYKNPRLWKKIHEANRDRIKNPNLIYPGWIIKVPKLGK